MSRRLPVLTGSEVVRALERAGFVVARIRGSYHVLEHPDGRKIVVPVHAGETLGSGLLRKIVRDTGMSKEEFRKLLG